MVYLYLYVYRKNICEVKKNIGKKNKCIEF